MTTKATEFGNILILGKLKFDTSHSSPNKTIFIYTYKYQCIKNKIFDKRNSLSFYM